MNNFIVGKTYTIRSICDHNCIFKAVVLKKTEKTVTIETRMEGPKTKKVMTGNDGEQYFYLFGKYSMAPIMRAYGLDAYCADNP